ncbi:MAG: 2-amino-4-hydroxy-6-hydroxymethyldihydropteridine diphosphokinase [Lentilitoribacter sp.]
MSNDLARAALGIGGNLGDTKQNLINVISNLAHQLDVEVLSVSKLYKTPPWGKTDQPAFLNACMLVETSLSARQLLDKCLDIEQKLGRVRGERWGPRQVDIDILFFGDEVIAEEGLEVPHPRMTDRAFVMQPLSDIAPDEMISGKLVSEWAKDLHDDAIEVVCEDCDWWM